MEQVQLYYAGTHIGAASVDDALRELSPSVVWRLEIPKTLRRSCQGRRDIVTAMLRDDPTALPRCHPYCWVASKIPLRLSRVALRTALIPLVNTIQQLGHAPPDILEGIRTLTSEVKSVIFINGNRVDCRSVNCKEVI